MKSLNFWRYYADLENSNKRELRKKIVEKCKIELSTFYTWLTNKKISKWQIEAVGYVVGDFFAEQNNTTPEEIIVTFEK